MWELVLHRGWSGLSGAGGNMSIAVTSRCFPCLVLLLAHVPLWNPQSTHELPKPSSSGLSPRQVEPPADSGTNHPGQQPF
jgi:hypothetical protein